MNANVWHRVVTLGALTLLGSGCLAQKIPVVITAPSYVNEDQTAMRFTKSLADDIQLSGKFYYWKDFKNAPLSCIQIAVRSIQIKLDNGVAVGSAIFVEAERPSAKEPGYNREIAEQMFYFPTDAPVADETHSFLASVDREMGR
jgi:hypothetical protein